MMLRVTFLWVLGMIAIVPYSIYQLLFVAEREEYAFHIVMPLFWIFGFWGVVGPLITAIRIRRLFKTLEMAQSAEKMKEILASSESEDLAIEVMASENHIPKFVARFFYKKFIARLAVANAKQPGDNL